MTRAAPPTVVYERRFEVPGRPVPAVRMTRAGVHAPNHPKRRQIDAYLSYKQAVGWAAKQAGAYVIDGPVALSINIHLRDRMKRRWDISNILKGIEDSLNNICYYDDKQITALSIRVYSAARTTGEERVVIWVSPCT